MYLNARLSKLERAEKVVGSDGHRRCRVCGDGAKLASVARYADRPDWGHRGGTGASVGGTNSCAACGRVPAEDVVVVGIDPESL